MLENHTDLEKKSKLFGAAYEGDLVALQAEYSEEYRNIRDEQSGLTLIETAASAGHADIILFLLQNDLSHHNLIFDFLIANEQWEILERIIAESSFFNTNAIYHDNNENTIHHNYLYQLALDGQWDIFELLIDKNYPIDFCHAPTENHMNAFDIITYIYDSDEMYHLCEKIIAKYEITFLNTPYKAEEMILPTKINALIPSIELTPIEHAVKSGSYFWIKHLLAHGAKECLHPDSLPLEYYAIKSAEFDILKYLHNTYRKCSAAPIAKTGKYNNIPVAWFLIHKNMLELFEELYDGDFSSVDFNFSPSGKYENTSIAWMITNLSKDDHLIQKILSLPQKIDFSKHGNLGESNKISILEYFVRKEWLHLIIDHPLYQDILPNYFVMALYYGDINAIRLLKQKGIKPKLELENIYNFFKQNYPEHIKNKCQDSPHAMFIASKKPIDEKTLKKHSKKLRPENKDDYGNTLLFYYLLNNINGVIKHILCAEHLPPITPDYLQLAYIFNQNAYKKLSDVRLRKIRDFVIEVVKASGRKTNENMTEVPNLSSLVRGNLNYFFPDYSPASFIATPTNIINDIYVNITPSAMALELLTNIDKESSYTLILAAILMVLYNICRTPYDLPYKTVMHLRITYLYIYSKYYENDFSPQAQRPLTCDITKSTIAFLIVLLPEIEEFIKAVTFHDYIKDYLSLSNSIRSFSYVVHVLNDFIPLYLNIKITLHDHAHELSSDSSQTSIISFFHLLSDKIFRELLLAYLNSLQRFFSFYYVYNDVMKKIPNNEIYLPTLFTCYKQTSKFIDLMQNCYFDDPLSLCELLITTQKLMYIAFLDMYPSLEAHLAKPFNISCYNAKVTISKVQAPSLSSTNTKELVQNNNDINANKSPIEEPEKKQPTKLTVKHNEEPLKDNSIKNKLGKQNSHNKQGKKRQKEQQNKLAQQSNDAENKNINAEATQKILEEQIAKQHEEQQIKLEQQRKDAEAKIKATEDAKQKLLAEQAERKRLKKEEALKKRQEGNKHKRELQEQRQAPLVSTANIETDEFISQPNSTTQAYKPESAGSSPYSLFFLGHICNGSQIPKPVAALSQSTHGQQYALSA